MSQLEVDFPDYHGPTPDPLADVNEGDTITVTFTGHVSRVQTDQVEVTAHGDPEPRYLDGTRTVQVVADKHTLTVEPRT